MISFRLPRLSGKEAIRALKKGEFVIKRQSGSHAIMRHKDDPSRRCIIPLHGSRMIKPGTLHSILKGAGLSVEDFVNLLKK